MIGRTGLGEAAAFEHEDPVHPGEQRAAVRDEEGRAAGAQIAERRGDEGFQATRRIMVQ